MEKDQEGVGTGRCRNRKGQDQEGAGTGRSRIRKEQEQEGRRGFD
jgi:hypothetical protein